MKVAFIAALLLVTVASGAPDGSGWSLSDLITPFAQFAKLRQYMENIECVRNIVNKVMEESDMKWDWRRAIRDFDHIIFVEWKKCTNMVDGPKKDKCKSACVEQSTTILKDFTIILIKEMRLDLLNKIRIEIAAKCLPETKSKSNEMATFFDLQNNEFEENAFANESLPYKFECLVKVLKIVSMENDLENLWSEHETIIYEHLDKWHQCSKIDYKLKRLYCKLKEGYQTYRLITNYIQLAGGENGQIISKFASEYQQKCSSISYVDIFFSEVLSLGSSKF